VNCYRIHQKSLNFIYPFQFYSNFTNKNVSWLHFSWPTQYIVLFTGVLYCSQFDISACVPRTCSKYWNEVWLQL